MTKLLKSEKELNDFIWKEYPNKRSIKQNLYRNAMRKAYDFPLKQQGF